MICIDFLVRAGDRARNERYVLVGRESEWFPYGSAPDTRFFKTFAYRCLFRGLPVLDSTSRMNPFPRSVIAGRFCQAKQPPIPLAYNSHGGFEVRLSFFPENVL
jgi:hypothetical protein